MPFRDVIGHRPIVRLLARAIARDTLPPSLIFAGPSGVGKHTTALAVAQALNCQRRVAAADTANATLPAARTKARKRSPASEPQLLDPDVAPVDGCGECSACRRIVQGTHADVFRVVPEETGNIKVEQIRRAVEHTAYRPFEGRRRVVIIDDADAMNAAAQSALLKPLEEPPPASVFVLVTSQPETLLPTVRSRCTTLRFGPLGAEDVSRVLMASRKIDRKEAQALAALADGSPGAALAWKDEGLSDARSAAEHVLQGVARRDEVRSRLEQAKELLGRKGSRASERDQTASKLRALSALLRDLALLTSGGDERLLANADLAAALKRIAGSYSHDRITRAFSAVAESLAALDGNASPKIVADWVALRL
jgi:DNA polymerase-3 subunit delta'